MDDLVSQENLFRWPTFVAVIVCTYQHLARSVCSAKSWVWKHRNTNQPHPFPFQDLSLDGETLRLWSLSQLLLKESPALIFPTRNSWLYSVGFFILSSASDLSFAARLFVIHRLFFSVWIFEQLLSKMDMTARECCKSLICFPHSGRSLSDWRGSGTRRWIEQESRYCISKLAVFYAESNVANKTSLSGYF